MRATIGQLICQKPRHFPIVPHQLARPGAKQNGHAAVEKVHRPPVIDMIHTEQRPVQADADVVDVVKRARWPWEYHI